MILPPPLLGTGIGQLWVCPEDLSHEKVTARQLKGVDLETLAAAFGKPERYTLLVHRNHFVMSENRDYHQLGPVGLLSGVMDIACRIIPFETDLRPEQTKIWLRGDWA